MLHPSRLHVVTAISNPARWQSRLRLYREFEKHMLDSGVQLTVIECAYGEFDHHLAGRPGINHIPVHATTHVWIKENLLNLAIARLPLDWKYVAWIDADIEHRNPNWALQTLEQLQQYDFVQTWRDAYDLGPHGEHLQAHRSFCAVWHDAPDTIGVGNKGYTYAHPGYAWAATRRALEEVGGLLEDGILGAGDHHMAMGMIGKAEHSIHKAIHPNYRNRIMQWSDRAARHVAGNIGYVPGTIEHSWHGPKKARAYWDRWSILTRNAYDPERDIKRNTAGVLELAGNKPQLKRDIEGYFASRNEDSNSL